MSDFNKIRVELPSSEIQKFRRWTSKLSAENTAQLKTLIAAKSYTMQKGIMTNITNKGIVNFGFLRSSIRVSFASDRLGSTIDINPQQRKTPYGSLVAAVNYAPHIEFGTRPHVIQVRRAKVLAGYLLKPGAKKYGWMYFGKKVNHPGTKANPFFYPVAKRVYKELLIELNRMGFK
jgi:hypothetical protein